MRTAVLWMAFDSHLSHICTYKYRCTCFTVIQVDSWQVNSLTEMFLSTSEGSAEVCLRHWCNHLPWPIHSWHIHQSDPGCLQGATSPDCDWPSCWPSASHRGLLCQHSHHCPVQHWLTAQIRGHCHPLQQQGEISLNVRNKWDCFWVVNYSLRILAHC